MQKYGFVYIWYDRKHKRYYIGSHWGTTDDGYICSSRWMRKAFRRREQDFRRRIIAIVHSRADLLKEEERWLQMIKENEVGSRYYNLQRTTHHWHSNPDKMKSIGEKISKALTGRKRPDISIALTGRKITRKSPKPFSDEHKKNLSEAGKGRAFDTETRNKISKANIGKKRSDDIRDQRRELNKQIHTGMKRSEETKIRMSIAQKARYASKKEFSES